jgi:parallel beta-helix repeat protein
MEKITRRESLALIAMAVILALALFIVPGSAAELHVGSGQPYTTIQAAINAADTVNNTIIVHNGTYPENLVVSKSNITIRSDNGSSVTIINSNTTNKHVVNITDQTNVTLEGFTIRDARGTSQNIAGIYLNNATGCNISNNIVTNISATGEYNSACGIYLQQSSGNTFNSTAVSSITATLHAYGIVLHLAENNIFSSSTSVSSINASGINNSQAFGIGLWDSSDNTFSSSTFVSSINTSDLSSQAFGIYLYNASSNTFSSSTSVSNVTGGYDYGILLRQSSNNNISASTSVSFVNAGETAYGISLDESSNANTFNFTSVSSVTTDGLENESYGIFINSSSGNIFNSTAVSSITAPQGAYGILLLSSDINNFSISTSVSDIAADGGAAGIYLYKSGNNIFSSSTSVSNVTGDGGAFGVGLLSSDSNNFSISTSVSDIAADYYAVGISLISSNNNMFNSSTSVTTITSTAFDAYGIWLTESSNNTFSSSTFVSNVTGGPDPYGTTGGYDAYGIYLRDSSNNNFSASASVSYVNAPGTAYGISLTESSNTNTFNFTSVSSITTDGLGNESYGIFINSSSNNTFSSNTSVSTISARQTAYGIYLTDSSDDNEFTGITIHPTLTGSESYEFWSDKECDDNVVTDMTIGNSSTTISFTYGNGVWLKRVNVSERPGDPSNVCNIGKYINASNITTNSWLFVNFRYSESDVAGVYEDTLSVWKYNGTAWYEDGWSESRVLDTTKNVVGVNITSFSIFAPLGTPRTVIRVPEDYPTIQQAIDNVTDTIRTIQVNASAYNVTETVVVNQSNIIIRSVNGRAVVSAGEESDRVFNITDQTNVTLEGFTIRDAVGTNVAAGIYMENSSECNISNNIVTNILGHNFSCGIWLKDSDHNTFSFNTNVSSIFKVLKAYGIYLEASNNNNFSSNTSVSDIKAKEEAHGIYLNSSSNNTFSSSTNVSSIYSQELKAYGISLTESSNTNTFNFTSVSSITTDGLENESYGIFINSSSNNTFSANTTVSTIIGDNAYGIYLSSSNNNRFNSSTSVSNITANQTADGINLASSDSNTFSSSTTVSAITANQTAYGIQLDNSSKNSFSSNTTISTITAKKNHAYGVFLQYNSDDNTFTGITIRPAIVTPLPHSVYSKSDDHTFTRVTIIPTPTGGEFYEFYSEANCTDNVVKDMTIGNSSTTISFTYGNGLRLKRVEAGERPPSDPHGVKNIGKYVNATNGTANSWLFLNVSYNESDLGDIDESSLRLWRYNGTWTEVPGSGVNTTENSVYANITEFSIFAPLGYAPASVTIPTATGKGNVTIITSSGEFCNYSALNETCFPYLPESGATFHYGFFNFSICNITGPPPQNVTITFVFPSAIPTNAEFWKYNSSNGTWYPFPFGDNDGDNIISINITDNGPGDHNPAIGTITDPNAVALPLTAAAPVPTLTPLGMLAVISVLSVIAATTITKRKRR